MWVWFLGGEKRFVTRLGWRRAVISRIPRDADMEWIRERVRMEIVVVESRMVAK
jgi:hypothetical protein